MSRSNPDVTCATCRFWNDATGDARFVQCRRTPPPWIRTERSDWCGEWVGMPDRGPTISRPDEVGEPDENRP